MKKIFFHLLAIILFVTLVVPTSVFATQSGGGYIVNDQINSIPGVIFGTGYSSNTGGNPASQVVTGGGYSVHAGMYINSVPPSVPPVVPPGGGGGGGGGGSGGGGGGNAVLSIGGQNGSLTPSFPSTGIITGNPTFSEIVAITAIGKAPYRVDPFPDNKIDILDFNVLMINWGKNTGENTDKHCNDKILADINCDGKVDMLDFNLLMVYWGMPVQLRYL